MTLKIHTQEDDARQLTVTVEVDEERVENAMRKAARKYASDLRIPGFRPGKAPYGVIRGIVGEDALRQEAVEALVPGVFTEVGAHLDAAEVAVMSNARPSLDDIEYTPLVLKFTIPLEPVVVLGDYRSVRQSVEPVEITPDAIDEAIETLRQSRATTEESNAPAAIGDEITISGVGYLDDDEADIIFREEEMALFLEADVVYEGTPFGEALIGMVVGEEKSFDIAFPDPYEPDPSLNGRTAHMRISLHKVVRHILPELSDEFAASLPQAYESLEELRTATAERLQREAREQQRNDVIEKFIQQLVENVEALSYPRGAIEAQIDHQIDDIKQMVKRINWDWDDYLVQSGRSEAEMRDDFEDNAVTIVERGIVFDEFLRRERLSLSMAEIDAEIEARVATYDAPELRTHMARYLRDNSNSMLFEQLMSEKVYARILAIYSGEAPELTTADDDETAADGADTADAADEAGAPADDVAEMDQS